MTDAERPDAGRDSGERIIDLRDSVLVPRAIIWALAVGVPALVASGAWFSAAQSRDVVHLVDELSMLKASMGRNTEAVDVKQAVRDAEIRVIDDRLTRMETQMTFLVNAQATSGPNDPRHRGPANP